MDFPTTCTTGYRFAFNGKENDNEVKGIGNQQDYGFRIYDTRIAKFLSVDPLTKDYPWYTPYQFAGNKPIQFIDLDGLEEANPATVKNDKKGNPTGTTTSTDNARAHTTNPNKNPSNNIVGPANATPPPQRAKAPSLPITNGLIYPGRNVLVSPESQLIIDSKIVPATLGIVTVVASAPAVGVAAINTLGGFLTAAEGTVIAVQTNTAVAMTVGAAYGITMSVMNLDSDQSPFPGAEKAELTSQVATFLTDLYSDLHKIKPPAKTIPLR